jgi:hypothetical protein
LNIIHNIIKLISYFGTPQAFENVFFFNFKGNHIHPNGTNTHIIIRFRANNPPINIRRVLGFASWHKNAAKKNGI